MFKIAKKISILFFVGIFLISSAEANWITKKSDKSKETIKKEKKEKSEWIKLKKLKDKIKIKKKKKEVKENKEEYKKEEKKITSTVKSWITKKTKTKYISSINDLPKGAIYFSGSNEAKDLLFYGYVFPDKNSKLIDGFYETSKGVGYFNDGKTTCQIGSTVLIVDQGELTSRVFGKCSNGLKFAGKTSQTKNSGWGQVKTSDGKERLNFDFNVNKTKIAKLYNKNKVTEKLVVKSLPSSPKTEIALNPTGKYYALLIGNSNYVKWASLNSPKNDVTEIAKILKNQYDFEKIITVVNGDRKKIFDGFKQLQELSTDKDYVLVYYSGHGEILNNQSFWIPVNAEKTLDSEWINISTLEGQIKSTISAHHIALMVDSCYFAVSIKGNKIESNKSQAYKKLLDRRSRMILSAGSNEPVDDTNSKHSIFGSSIISSLKKNADVIKMSDIIERVVLAHAGQRQQPYGVYRVDWGHGGGEFLFIKK